MSKKRIISVICILLVAVSIIMGAGKISREAEAYAKGFLEDYYTITDYDTYNYVKSNPLANDVTGQIVAKNSYDSYFTKEGIQEFVDGGMYKLLHELSYSNNCTVSLEKVKLDKVLDERDKYIIAYDYDAEVVVTDAEGNTHTVEQHGKVTLSTKDGMKISSFRIIDSASVLNAVSSMY